MKALILIQGASQQAVEAAMWKVIRLVDNDDNSISSLQLFATRQADTYALKPNKLYNGWDFVGLCFALIDAFGKEVHLDAWFRFDSETTTDLPSGRTLYVDFDYPGRDGFYLIDPKGRRWELLDHTDEETGADLFWAEITGEAPYRPYPHLQLIPLPSGQGRFEIGQQSRRRDLTNLWYWMEGNGMATLLIVVALSALAILCLCAKWDFNETLLTFSLPSWLPYVVIAAMGFLLTVLKVTFKSFSLWWRFFFNSAASLLVVGMIMVLAFSVNQWFESSEPVYGSGIVTEVEPRGKSQSDLSYNYHVDVDTPTEGKLFIRMHHDSSFYAGESVTIVFHRGCYGLYHAEKIEHR